MKNAKVELEAAEKALRDAKNDVLRFTAEAESLKKTATAGITQLFKENLTLFADYGCKINLTSTRIEIVIPVDKDSTTGVSVNVDAQGIFDISQSILMTRLRTTPKKNIASGIVYFLTQDVQKEKIYIDAIVASLRVYATKKNLLERAVQEVRRSGKNLSMIQLSTKGTRRLKGLLPLRIAAQLTEESARIFLKEFNTEMLRAQIGSSFGISPNARFNKKDMIDIVVERLYE